MAKLKVVGDECSGVSCVYDVFNSRLHCCRIVDQKVEVALQIR